MGNRLIMENICISEKINKLDLLGEVFFYRLLVQCDDYGVMDARPKILKARLFPLKRTITEEDVATVLISLAQKELIVLYTAGGKPYLQVVGWAEHQRIRDSKHKYPMPEEGEIIEVAAAEEDDSDEIDLRQFAASRGELRQVAANGGETRQTAADCGSHAQPRAGAESESESISESESRERTTRAGARGLAREDDDPAFDDFYREYPRKQKRPEALRAWKKIKPEAELVAVIMQGLARWKASADWQEDPRFIPYPASWLNNKRWEDEPRKAGSGGPRVSAQEYGQRDYAGEQDEAMRRMLDMMQA